MRLGLSFDDVQIVERYTEIPSRGECDTTCFVTCKETSKAGIPIVSAPMDTVTGLQMSIALRQLGGVPFFHRFNTIEERVSLVKASVSHHCPLAPVGAAVSLNCDYEKEAEELCLAGATIILIDTAHGNSKRTVEAVQKIKKIIPKDVSVIAGNTAVADGYARLADAGADGVRTGIGPGSMCETRIRTGIGIPQITAIMDIAKESEKYSYPPAIIADGGIKMPGDIAKALAAGADSVMIGGLFAATKESPGEIVREGIWPNERLVKHYRGAASEEAQIGRESIYIEGNSGNQLYIGKVDRVIKDIVNGLKSAMSYVGASNLKEFRQRAELIQITEAGRTEAMPHALIS